MGYTAYRERQVVVPPAVEVRLCSHGDSVLALFQD